MAMIQCRECGQNISSTAAVCPKCGAPVRRRSIASWLVIIMLVLIGLAVGMASCQDRASRKAGERAAQEQAQAKAQRAATVLQQQTEAFERNRAQVLAVTRAALDRGDLVAAQEALAPINRVQDLDLEPLRKELANKQQAARDAAEKTQLLERLAALKPGDNVNGAQIYAGLLKLDPDNKRYAKELAIARAANERAEAQAKADLLRAQRKALARTAEENFLKNGHSATVTTEGKDDTVLRIKYVLVSKAFAYQVQHQDEFITKCRELGFKRIVLDDGYIESWRIDLD